MSDEIIKYCNAHKMKVKIHRQQFMGKYVLMACEHTIELAGEHKIKSDINCGEK